MERIGLGRATSDREQHAARRRVLLVTASSDVKQQVLMMLRGLDHVRLLGATRNVEELHLWIDALQPDVVLLHVPPSEAEVAPALPAIADSRSRPVVVVLSDEPGDTVKRRYLAGGAQACLSLARPELDGLPDVLATL